jgi:UDP-N-acetylmuramoylalanine--D-glutamate ligase
MGLGLHGGALGNIEWLVEQGAKVTVTDLKNEKELKTTVQKMQGLDLLNKVNLVLGEHREEDFTGADLVLRNPAVPRKSKYLEMARAAGVPVEMDSSLFFEACPSPKIIGVTGSKGKTTTSNAIAVLLKAKYPQTVAVGIDGVSPLAELKSVREDSPVVFELSSWRLEALDEKRISPKIAVVTSLLRDHLNTYDSFEHYVATKKIIIDYQGPDDIAILNVDDELVRQWAPEVKGSLWWYSVNNLEQEKGIFVREGRVIVRLDKEVEIIGYDDLPLTGEHERRNLLPGILLAVSYGVPVELIRKELATIHRLPHRLEEVRELNGVLYVNDSAATMPEATIAALAVFKDREIVHILGGSDKALRFEELAQKIKRAKVKTLIWLPGTATGKMKLALVKAGVVSKSKEAVNMTEAVKKAQRAAGAGQVVLMSPAATSFGLFKHEFDRGDQFRAAVLALS